MLRLALRVCSFPANLNSYCYFVNKQFLSQLNDFDEARGFVYPFPKEKLTIKTVRSSGPGGQNRDKRETKVQIKVNIALADWISDRTKDSLAKQLDNSGNLHISDETSRSQSNNKKECMDKLYRLLLEHSYVPPQPTHEELEAERRQEKARKEKWKQANRAKKYYRNRDNPFC